MKSHSLRFGILSTLLPLLSGGLLLLTSFLRRLPQSELLRFIVTGIIIFAPLAGILFGVISWIRARVDSKKLSDAHSIAERRPIRIGKTLGVVGTLLAFLYYYSVLDYFGDSSVIANRKEIKFDIEDIADHAYEYRSRPRSERGGAGSYLGYELPQKLRYNENGTFEISVQSGDTLIILATSAAYTQSTMTAIVDANGKIVRWTYRGDFSP